MLHTFEISWRATATKPWPALTYCGTEGVDELAFGLHRRPVQISQELKSENFQILNHVVFRQVLVACYKYEITNQTLLHVKGSGECWVGVASWYGKSVIRMSMFSWATSENDMKRSAGAFVSARKKSVLK